MFACSERKFARVNGGLGLPGNYRLAATWLKVWLCVTSLFFFVGKGRAFPFHDSMLHSDPPPPQVHSGVCVGVCVSVCVFVCFFGVGLLVSMYEVSI